MTQIWLDYEFLQDSRAHTSVFPLSFLLFYASTPFLMISRTSQVPGSMTCDDAILPLQNFGICQSSMQKLIRVKLNCLTLKE